MRSLRAQAIRQPEVEFLAIVGHPFIDALLQYSGSYDFGGLTAKRVVKDAKLSGLSGYLFAFVVRERITREDGDECLFRLEPVFVTADGKVDEAAAHVAVINESTSSSDEIPPDSASAYQIARSHLEHEGNIWVWADDVEFLGVSWVMFR